MKQSEVAKEYKWQQKKWSGWKQFIYRQELLIRASCT